MADKVFVSPGVYTSEKDLSFVTRQVGVTTLQELKIMEHQNMSYLI
jgi:hypothetical protein